VPQERVPQEPVPQEPVPQEPGWALRVPVRVPVPLPEWPLPEWRQ
jgi:hypothetical protein